MRVLIAGAGEVGFRVARDLVYRGHEVTLVDSNPTAVKRAQTVSYTHLTLPTILLV